MLAIAALWPAVLGAIAGAAASNPSRTVPPLKRQDDDSVQFVSTRDGKFTVGNDPLKFVGTNAYWLHTLNTDQDIDNTLADISQSGVKVVRTWAFNDVTTVPDSGVYFSVVNPNGTVTVNDGPNGLQKLDKVVELAEKHNLYLLLSLTNNWNPNSVEEEEVGAGPDRRSDMTIGRRADGTPLPRNTLSNDYGGMDTYVRQFGLKNHDEFYTNPKVKDAFKYYTKCVVERYADSPAIFGWELANDPRCNSTLPSSTCDPQAVTKWHSEIAKHVKAHDPNHLVASGNGGQFCVECPKLFPREPVAPPQVSPAPGATRRRDTSFLTKARVLAERTASRKSARLAKRNEQTGGAKIRGRWTPTATRRQDSQELGPAFDGTYGVDSEDIANIPEMGFGSFQLFPDQNGYGENDPNLSAFENIVSRGSDWIRRHAESAASSGKPMTLNGFGLVTRENAPRYVPFNSNAAPFGSSEADTQSYGVTIEQRDTAYNTWLDVGRLAGLTSMIQYQWGQDGLTTRPGTTVSSAVEGTDVTGAVEGTGVSPNDGYASNAQGSDIPFFEQAAQAFGSDTDLR